METEIRNFLFKTWNKSLSQKITFSPVPKEEKGEIALSFFEISKEISLPPSKIAKKIAKILATFAPVKSTEIKGPYLNVLLTNEFLFASALQVKNTSKILLNKKIVLEFSGPNTNKPLHLGHMRNHALGISLSNILEAAGATVKRVNIINDRGMHICKSMLAYKLFAKKNESPATAHKKGDHFVGEFYTKYESQSKKNPQLQKQIQTMLRKWEQGKKETRALWQKMNRWAQDGQKETYRRQGVKFDKEYTESDYYEQGKKLAQKGLEAKMFQKKPDGTIFIDLKDENLGQKVIMRSNGTSIYLTQDLAIAKSRTKDFAPDQLIYVVADEQNRHFEILFTCLEKLKIISRKKCTHLRYGLVNLPDGRMKSREGNIVEADNLMDSLTQMARKEISKRNKNFTTKEISVISEQIQNAAWKFYLLSVSPQKTMTFFRNRSISFDGATGPYVQYSGVRIRSLFSKNQQSIKTKFTTKQCKNFAKFLGEAERPLGGKLLQFKNALARAVETKNPTFLVTYILNLCQTWSSYYSNTNILKSPPGQKEARLALAAKVYYILESSLRYLGIEIPQQM